MSTYPETNSTNQYEIYQFPPNIEDNSELVAEILVANVVLNFFLKERGSEQNIYRVVSYFKANPEVIIALGEAEKEIPHQDFSATIKQYFQDLADRA